MSNTNTMVDNNAQLKTKIQEIFDYAASSREASAELYKLVIPDFESIKKIKGCPVVDKNLWTYIWRLFIQLDRRLHPEEFAGAVWIDKSFGMNSSLEEGTIDMSKCRVVYAENA